MAMLVTDANFAQEVEQSKELVLVDFYAPWCGPCMQLLPTIESLAEEMKDSVKIVKMNVDEESETPARFGIMSIPALKFFKGGTLVGEISGFVPKQVIVEKIQSLS